MGVSHAVLGMTKSYSKHYEVGIDYDVDGVVYHAVDFYRFKTGLKEGRCWRQRTSGLVLPWSGTKAYQFIDSIFRLRYN